MLRGPNEAIEPRLSARYTQSPCANGHAVQSPFAGTAGDGADGAGVVGAGVEGAGLVAGAGVGEDARGDAGTTAEHPVANKRAEKANMILIADEYGQKHGAALVPIFYAP